MKILFSFRVPKLRPLNSLMFDAKSNWFTSCAFLECKRTPIMQFWYYISAKDCILFFPRGKLPRLVHYQTSQPNTPWSSIPHLVALWQCIISCIFGVELFCYFHFLDCWSPWLLSNFVQKQCHHHLILCGLFVALVLLHDFYRGNITREKI